jgi:hypothetical protein
MRVCQFHQRPSWCSHPVLTRELVITNDLICHLSIGAYLWCAGRAIKTMIRATNSAIHNTPNHSSAVIYILPVSKTIKVKQVAITTSSNIILCPRPHAGLFRQVLVPRRRHLPQVSDLQHHPQGYLPELVLVVEYELHQLIFRLTTHRVLLQHTGAHYLSDTEHTVPHAVNGQVQVVASAL